MQSIWTKYLFIYIMLTSNYKLNANNRHEWTKYYSRYLIIIKIIKGRLGSQRSEEALQESARRRLLYIK